MRVFRFARSTQFRRVNHCSFGYLLSIAAAVAALPSMAAGQTAEDLWQRGEYQSAANLIAKTNVVETSENRWEAEWKQAESLDRWKELYRKEGQLKILLDALVRIDPDDARSRLERLDLESDPLDVRFAEELEKLLQTPRERWPFDSKGRRNATRFHDYFDLTYRLMRLYEKQGKTEELCRLGLRLAHGEPPFERWSDIPPETAPSMDSEPQHINACLALTIQHGDEKVLAELESCLPREKMTESWLSARPQLARRTSGNAAQSASPAVGWANLPKGVSAWVCSDTVLSVACDDKYIYAGMPWGIAVYDHTGQPITRVALAAAADGLTTTGDTVWALTGNGLFSVTRDTWTAASLSLGAHLPGDSRQAVSVTAADYDGRFLWIGTTKGVQRYEPSTGQIAVYDSQEVPTSVDRFFFDGPYVWCRGGRYDAGSDSWKAIRFGDEPVSLIACVDGVAWGVVQVQEQMGHRPCIISPVTLQVTPILIDASDQYQSGEHGPFAYRGKWDGRPVFNEYYFDAWEGRLFRLPNDAAICPVERVRHDLRGVTERSDARFQDCEKPGVVRLPNGTRVVGASVGGYPNWRPYRDYPEARESMEAPAGLCLVSENEPPLRFPSSIASDSLPGNMVMGAVLAPAPRQYIYTAKGLAAFDETRGVFAHYRVPQGLCANHITGAAYTKDCDYFSTRGEWDWGGLAVYDSRTGVFTPLLRSDGLISNKLSGLEQDGDTALISYDLRSADKTPQGSPSYPAALLDLRTGAISHDEKAAAAQKRDLAPAEQKAMQRTPMPYLGGWVTFEQAVDGKTYVGGTRGLLILTAPLGQTPPLAVESLVPSVSFSAESAALREAAALNTTVDSAESLDRYLNDPSPEVRFKAINSIPILRPALPAPGRRCQWITVSEIYLPALHRAAKDPDPQVRKTALSKILDAVESPESIPVLRGLANDTDPSVRLDATVELLRRGEKADLEPVRKALEADGANGSANWIYTSIAEHADAAVVEILAKFPPIYMGGDQKYTLLRRLAAVVRRNTEAAQVLLHTVNDPILSAANYDRGICGPNQGFAAAVFQSAGKDILPLLHDALKGDEPLVRANAAYACGVINDPSSIPHLVEMFAYNDKLTMKGLRSALGDSDSPDAPPLLARLFAQCDKDTESLRKEWDEVVPPRDINSAGILTDEEKLKVDAVRKKSEQFMFPREFLDINLFHPMKQPQAFFRALAATNSELGQLEAARHLADAQGDDKPKNAAALKPLLDSPQQPTRITAAVSLVMLGDAEGQNAILNRLQSGNEAELNDVLQELRRIKDPNLREFARVQLESLVKKADLSAETRSLAVQLL